MKEKTVTHPGLIKSVDGSKAEVMVVANAACGTCEVKGACSVSESEEKIIEVDLMPGDNYSPGQAVEVEMKQSLGNWAVLLGYFFPFLFVLGSLIIFINSGIDQGLSGLLSLLVLGVYYLLLYLLRGFLKSKFTYNVRP